MAAPHLTLSDSIEDRKRALRGSAVARRAGSDPGLGALMAERLLAEWAPFAGAAIAGYWPIRSEIDCRPLLCAMHRRGHVVGLPVTPAPGAPLGFRRWTPQATMLPGRYGTMHPDGAAMVPELLFVPLLAFDRRCHRLGYGGGYYDRTLAALPAAQAIGCAYAAQEIAHVPTTLHDIRLQAIATECGVVRPAPASTADMVDHA